MAFKVPPLPASSCSGWVSDMAQGWSIRGTCYKDGSGLTQAVVSQYPQQQGNDVMYLKAAPTWAAPNLAYTVWSGTNVTSDAITLSLPVCDTADVPADPLFSVVMFAACSVMFGLGFIGTR